MTVIASYSVEANLEATDATTVYLTRKAGHFFDEEGLARFEIAASEALTNIVRHGYTSCLKGDIAIRLEAERQEVVHLILSDTGSTVPASVFKRPALLDDEADPIPREDGWGIGLLHQCASAVEYGRDAGRNVLTLTFKTRPED